MIGEFEKQYNEMLGAHPDLLMAVCGDDMDAAYNIWLNFLSEMEKFAIEQDVNINGAKIWINVFWDVDGTIKHIAFYPKPNSINMEYGYMKVLFSQFSEQYNSGLNHTNLYSLYGSASFPSFITSSGNEDK